MHMDGAFPVQKGDKQNAAQRFDGLQEIFERAMAGLSGVKEVLPPDLQQGFEWHILNARQAHKSLMDEYAHNKK